VAAAAGCQTAVMAPTELLADQHAAAQGRHQPAVLVHGAHRGRTVRVGSADLAGGEGGGFAVVASSLSEALVATAAGLAVAIVALSLYNYLNTRVGAIAAVYARASERLVQAIIYVDAQASRAAGGAA